VKKIIHKWKTFRTVFNLARSGKSSKFTPRSDGAMHRETSQTLKALFRVLHVKVNDSTIRKILKSVALLDGLPGKSLFSLKRTRQHSLGL